MGAKRVFTVDEMIAGEIQKFKFHNGLIDEEPTGPDFHDLPEIEDITADWIAEFALAYPQEVLQYQAGYNTSDGMGAVWHLRNAAIGIMVGAVGDWCREMGISPWSTYGKPRRAIASDETMVGSNHPDHPMNSTARRRR